jgi:predicted nucleic acid-binding protein
MIRIYLDSCCFNRLFDDQIQTRVRAETEAVQQILSAVARGEWELIRSEVVEVEVGTIPDRARRREVLALVATGTVRLPLRAEHIERAQALQMPGFTEFDALHVASAEAAGAHVLLTTDDGMVRRARRLADKLSVRLANPLTWLDEVAPR